MPEAPVVNSGSKILSRFFGAIPTLLSVTTEAAAVLLSLCSDRWPPSSRHSLHGVLEQVIQNSPHLRWISLDHRDIVAQSAFDLCYWVILDGGPIYRLLHEGLDVDLLPLRCTRAGKLEQALDDPLRRPNLGL